MPAELMVAAKAVNSAINDIYEFGKDRYKEQLSKARASSNINSIYRKLSKVEKVKTIWQVDKEISLKKFYYPPRIIVGKDHVNISSIKKLPDENLVIQGMVGQGKSIFMRYLCSQEVKYGSRLPVFFELRKLEDGKGIVDHIKSILDSYNFKDIDLIFDFLCSSGKLVFFLDGFDEVNSEFVSRTINEIELLAEKYPDLKIIISSRPDSGVQNSTAFQVLKFSPLNESDLKGILNKIVEDKDKDSAKAEEIFNAIKRSSTRVQDLLQTPLMITLLVIIYRTEQKIPDQLSDFYENLFPVLLYRHDKSKPGFVRERRAEINEKKLQNVFEAFCLFTRKEQLLEIKFDRFHEIADKASYAEQVDCDSSGFIHDITKVSNLIIEEGGRYHFIHKSVQEFYSANYIKKRSDLSAQKFYSRFFEKSLHVWGPELNFLNQIDAFRFNKYYMIPMYAKFFKIFGFEGDKWSEIGLEKTKEMLKIIHVKYFWSAGSASPSIRYGVVPFMKEFGVSECQVRITEKLALIGDSFPVFFNERVFEIVEKKRSESKDSQGAYECDSDFYEVLQCGDFIEEARTVFNEVLGEEFLKYLSVIDSVRHEERNIILMDI